MQPEKILPHDLESEEAVLGSVLIDGSCIEKIASKTKSTHFYNSVNQEIYLTFEELLKRSEAIDQVTVAHELFRIGRLEACGGAANLSRLISICPTSLDVENYANIVTRLYLNRELIRHGKRISEIGYEVRPDFNDSLKDAENTLYALQQVDNGNGLVHISDVLDEYLEPAVIPQEGDQIPFLLTGFNAVDDLIGGIQRTDLAILAGRPGAGKTSLALSIAHNIAAFQKGCIAIFSLEMAKEELVVRMLSSESGVDSRKFNFWHTDELDKTDDEEKRLMQAVGALSNLDIYIDDSPFLRVNEIRSKVRKLNHDKKLDLIIVDHLGLMQSDNQNGNRVNEISYISRNLKALARDLKVPVMALSQLSRATEHRDDPKPRLSDLRDSGSIEQDADLVCFIFRESYYSTPDQWAAEHPGIPYPANEADVIIAKNRKGPQGEVKLTFERQLVKFSDYVVPMPPQKPKQQKIV